MEYQSKAAAGSQAVSAIPSGSSHEALRGLIILHIFFAEDQGCWDLALMALIKSSENSEAHGLETISKTPLDLRLFSVCRAKRISTLWAISGESHCAAPNELYFRKYCWKRLKMVEGLVDIPASLPSPATKKQTMCVCVWLIYSFVHAVNDQ